MQTHGPGYGCSPRPENFKNEQCSFERGRIAEIVDETCLACEN